MSNPITVSHLGTLIIDDKNLPLQSDFNLLINQFDQFNNLILNDSGNFVTWTAPTSILSITSLSSLPDSFIFVRNISTKLRITLDGNLPLHSSDVSKMISYIHIIVNGIRYNLDLTTSRIVINPVNRTIDFNYIATDLSDHVIKMKLRSASTIDIGTEINIEYTISVLASNIFQFPTIDNTTKNSPHDILDVTVGQTLSMTSTFSNNIHSDIVSTVIINDGFSNINVVSSVSDNNINYSFTIINDFDHSGIITLSFGDVDNNYSWSANGLLTAINDIYTFPNYVSYDASINNYDTGIDLKSELSNTLILHFTGGDHLYSDIYSSQVSSITYKTGNNGNIITVNSSDVVINSATDYETITVNNIVPTEVEDVYIYITLKGPDGAIMISPLTITISNSKIESGVLIISWNANHVSSGYSYANASDKEITTTINLNDTIKINSSVNVWPGSYDGKGYSALPSQFLEDDFEVVIANYNMGFQYANLYVTNDPNATITDFDSQYPNTSSHSSLTIQHQMKHGGSFQFANGGTLPFNSDIFGASGAKYRVLAGQTDNPNSAWGGRVYFSGTNNPRRNVFIKYKREGNNFSAVWSQNGVTGPWITDRSGIPELGFDNGYSSIMQIPDGYNKLLVGFSNSQNSGTSSAWPKYNIILDYNKIISIEQNKENALNMIGTSSTIETINAKYFRMRIINPVNNTHCSWFHRIGFYSNYNNAKTDIGNFSSDPNQSWNWNGQNDSFSENQDLIRWRYKTNTSNIQIAAGSYASRTTDQVLRNAPYTLNLIGSNPDPTWVNNNGFHKLSSFSEYLLTVEFELIGGIYQDIQVIKFGNMRKYGDSHTQIEFYTSPDNSTWTQVYCYYYPDPTNISKKIYTHQGAMEHNQSKSASYPTPANLKMANLLNPASGSTTMPQTNDPVYGFLTTTEPPPPPSYWIGIYGENSLSASYQYHTELEIEFSDSTFIGNSTHGSGRSILEILDNTIYTTTYSGQGNVMNLFDGNFGTAYTPTGIPVGNNSMFLSLKIDRDPSTIVGGRLCVQNNPYRFSSYKIYRTTLDPSLHTDVQDVNNGDWVLAAPLTLSSNYTGW